MTQANPIVRLAGIAAGIHCLALLAQPVLAGMILGGSSFDALDAHLWNGRLVVGLCVATSVLFAFAWRRGSGNGGKALTAVGLLAAEILQFFLGYAGDLTWHVPLGATIVAAASVLAYVSLRPPDAVAGATATR